VVDFLAGVVLLAVVDFPLAEVAVVVGVALGEVAAAAGEALERCWKGVWGQKASKRCWRGREVWKVEGHPMGEVEEKVAKAWMVVVVGLLVVVVEVRRLCR